MRLAKVTLLAGVVACAATVFAQSGPRRDGNWDVTVEMQMPGMPTLNIADFPEAYGPI